MMSRQVDKLFIETLSRALTRIREGAAGLRFEISATEWLEFQKALDQAEKDVDQARIRLWVVEAIDEREHPPG